MNIRVEHLYKRFGNFIAVNNVNLEIASGSLVALLGPSGSGKSTLLRILSGLDVADSGTVLFDGERADQLHARLRSVGFVFQHYALFRHMTVQQNIAFGLEVRKTPANIVAKRVDELVELTGLHGLGKRYPAQLSGGQRQRVALARALAPEPRILLLDEPFAAVDAKVRDELRHWLRRLHDEVGVTSIFVTHDQEEAFAVADRVAVIAEGRVEQTGTPTEILDNPATEFVASFVGEVNVYDAEVRGGIAFCGALHIAVPGQPDHANARLVIRSYDIKLWREEPGIATVERVVTFGDRVRVQARIDDCGMVMAQFPRRSSLLRGIEPGCRVQMEVTTARAYVAS